MNACSKMSVLSPPPPARVPLATAFSPGQTSPCSSYVPFASRVCYWLSFAEQGVSLPGEFIRLVTEKCETTELLSAGEGKEGALLIVL